MIPLRNGLPRSKIEMAMQQRPKLEEGEQLDSHLLEAKELTGG